MLPGADFIYLLTDKFTGLRGGGFTFALILARTFDSLFLGHIGTLGHLGTSEFAGEIVGRPTGVSTHYGHRVVGMQRNYGASAKISIRVRHSRKIARAIAEPGVTIIRGSLIIIRMQQRNPGRCDDQGERAELRAKRRCFMVLLLYLG